MAAYIPVPRDLTRVKSKVFFNLTKRQLICFGAAALIGVPFFFLLKSSGNVSLAALGMIIVMLPLFFLAMYEKDGQPLEVIAHHFIQAKFVRPKIRPYQTDNYYDVLLRQYQLEKEVERIVFPEEKTKAREIKMPALISVGNSREKLRLLIERAKKDTGIPQTAQQSIPFQRMFPDGICRVTDSYYTKTIQFQDINYQLAQQEDKTAIFDEWCSFLNFFDSSIHFELSFMNMGTDAESFEKSVRIPFKKDEFNSVRAEYSQMLKKQLCSGK